MQRGIDTTQVSKNDLISTDKHKQREKKSAFIQDYLAEQVKTKAQYQHNTIAADKVFQSAEQVQYIKYTPQ